MANKRNIEASVKNGFVVLRIPPGDAQYPNGKEYRFKSFTPTDAIIGPSGERIFPNNDGITAIALLGMSPEELDAMSERFEEAVRILDESEQLRLRMQALIQKMAPQYDGQIYLEFACLGKNVHQDIPMFPDKPTIRVLGFALEGVEFRDKRGRVLTYKLALDQDGKFDYNPDGILYVRD